VFVQVIVGRVGDDLAIRRLFRRWDAEVAPAAVGFIGVTAGACDDGTAVAFVRFADEASAVATARRSEHADWWQEMLQVFATPRSVHESSDISSLLAGSSDDAGFVQVIRAATPDRVRIDSLMTPARIAEVQESRPDLIGSDRVWLADGSFIELAYFTSESAARAAEQSDNFAEVEAPFFEAYGPMTFADLRTPIFLSPR
jgi:hypothetical protein